METSEGNRGILDSMGEARPEVETPEESPLARARLGDREAFEGLVQSHLPAVWRIVWRIVRHREDCEDVVQEVFLAAWQGLPGYRGEARFSTWLHTIAVTRSLNHLDRASERVRRASSPLVAPNGEDHTPEAVRAMERTSAHAPSPLQALEAGELMRRLAHCLEKLPAPWRAVIALRDSEELSYEEIARLMDLALGTVRSRLARARIALRQCVEGRA